MNHAKFVLLQEPIPASEASNLLCRVVASKVAPLMAAAPFLHNSHHHHHHHRNNNCQDSSSTMFTSAAVPKTSPPIKLSDFMAMARGQGVAPQVARLLDLHAMHPEEQAILLQCRMVRRHLLPDPDAAFRSLMKSGEYARDVRSLLEQYGCGGGGGGGGGSARRAAYFVTGFLTATDDSWLVEAGQHEQLRQFSVALPYSDAADMPVPFLYQDLLGPELAVLSGASSQQLRPPPPPGLANEQIFAVAYRLVTLPQQAAMSPISPLSGCHLSPPGARQQQQQPPPPPPPRRPKRTNAYHLASRRTEEAWIPSSSAASSPETVPHYDDGVKLDDDDAAPGLRMEEAAYIVV